MPQSGSPYGLGSQVLVKGFFTNTGSGLGVTYTSTTLTDALATWTTNQWVGSVVTVIDANTGLSITGTVMSNTTTVITLTSSWTSYTPTDGSTFTIPNDPGTVNLTYRKGNSNTDYMSVYGGAGSPAIIRVSVGLYYALFDTTGAPGDWEWEFWSTGSGAAAPSNTGVFTVNRSAVR